MLRDRPDSGASAPRRAHLLRLTLALGPVIVIAALALCLTRYAVTPGASRSPRPASPDALAAVRAAVEKRSLVATRLENGIGSAARWALRNEPNRFAASFSSQGWSLSPLPAITPEGRARNEAGDASPWMWRYELTSIARGDAVTDVGTPVVSGSEETVTLDRSGGIREWYKNTRSGIEQGFEIPERPLTRGSGELIVRGAVETSLSLLSTERDSLTFGRSGEALVRYAELAVFDAKGLRLPSRISFEPRAAGGDLAIYIDDSNADYPVTVDPMTSSPLWSTAGPTSSQFGYSVASAGDVDGDGYTDVVVGAPSYSNGESGEGAVYLFLGSANGPSTNPTNLIEGDEIGAKLGFSVAGAGDTNGDGYDDVVVGAPDATGGCGSPYMGAAYLYVGSPSGLVQSPAWFSQNCSDGNNYAWSVSGAGDVNNDGYSDAIVGCTDCYANVDQDGNAFLFLGSATGLASVPAWSWDTDDLTASGALFGSSVASAGDVNNDGYSDVLVGADNWTGVGRAFLFQGSPSGLSSAWSRSLPASTRYRVSAAGDVNGDGFGDVLVGMPDYNPSGENGMAELYFGSGSGLSNGAAWSASGIGLGFVGFAQSVASAGDINGDGYGDLLIGYPNYQQMGVQFGRVYLFLGSATGPASEAAWIATGETSLSSLGHSLAPADDVNGDGCADIIVGNPSHLADSGLALIWSEFNIECTKPTPSPTPTPTPISVSPGDEGLPAPTVTTSGRSATITAPKVTAQLTSRARKVAIKKLIRQGLSRAQATRALSNLAISYIFTVRTVGTFATASDSRAVSPAAQSGEAEISASSITRRSKRNQVTINNLPPGTRVASYRIEIATRKPPVVLGTTKPSGQTPFTITR